jgi:hypothetical protein
MPIAARYSAVVTAVTAVKAASVASASLRIPGSAGIEAPTATNASAVAIATRK